MCCNRDTEEQLRHQARADFHDLIHHHSRSLQGLLATTADALRGKCSHSKRRHFKVFKNFNFIRVGIGTSNFSQIDRKKLKSKSFCFQIGQKGKGGEKGKSTKSSSFLTRVPEIGLNETVVSWIGKTKSRLLFLRANWNSALSLSLSLPLLTHSPPSSYPHYSYHCFFLVPSSHHDSR